MKYQLISFMLFATLACPAAYAAGNEQEAKKHFNAGQIHYKLGRFDKALKEYSAAYEIMPLAGFLFNLGQCHRNLKHYERAIFFYEGYLRDKPKARNRAVVEELLAECRGKLDEQPKQELALREEERRLKEEREKKERQERLALAATSRPAPEVEEPKISPFYKTWWFWTIVGGVAAAAAGGTIYAATSDKTTVLPSGSLGTWDRREY